VPGSGVVQFTYAAACAVAYSPSTSKNWVKFASLVLESAYESTLWIALLNAEKHKWKHGSNKVFLTLLGGGVFGNNRDWILNGIEKAIQKFSSTDLKIYIVSFNFTCPKTKILLEKYKTN